MRNFFTNESLNFFVSGWSFAFAIAIDNVFGRSVCILLGIINLIVGLLSGAENGK